jgi:hypothetical protein
MLATAVLVTVAWWRGRRARKYKQKCQDPFPESDPDTFSPSLSTGETPSYPAV